MYREHNRGVLPVGLVVGGGELEMENVESLEVDAVSSAVEVNVVPVF